MPPKSIWQHSINLLYPQLLTSEFHRWYPPRDLSVESIPNRKSKILSSPEFIQNRLTDSKGIRIVSNPCGSVPKSDRHDPLGAPHKSFSLRYHTNFSEEVKLAP
ncbi:MAG: hypothetical protein EAZ45_04410 [Oscillatoriales cyanobacterium]|nr:MAG: hypothetical protein EAZ45_04410 [Oscillatoriales cyanobacterium]